VRKNWAVPDIKFSRTRFSLDHSVKTTMNVGTLYPLDIVEVLPGDTIKCKLTAVMRAGSAFIKPVMDNLDLEIYHFFVPLRLCQNDAEQIFGVANPSSYTANVRSSAATVANSSTVSVGTVADYLGLPVGTIPAGVSCLPFRAFANIYNDWFRNENIVQEVLVNKANYPNSNEVINSNAWSASNYFGLPPKVSKRRDYFTSCLPSPQKGPAIDLPLGATARLKTGSEYSLGTDKIKYGPHYSSQIFNVVADGSLGSSFAPELKLGNSIETALSTTAPYYTNLYADLSAATAASVNDVRLAFQLQKMLERDALFGTTYREYLRGHYGVVSPDARVQITEFLGGGKIPVGITQVAQTSETSSTALGTVAGYSFTNGFTRFSKGFTEHGYILTVGCLRQRHTYHQGINKLWMRQDREDFYDPLLANIGEQPVYTSEIFAANQSSLKGNVFGYQEAFAEYRHLQNRVTGHMRRNTANTYGIYTFQDMYSGQPYLNSSFVLEDYETVDYALATKYGGGSGPDQFVVDMFFDMPAIRVLPAYSVPGLIDHH
jgi:hypothetical protein